MEKLNSIFYGPAGTGKTRESIRQAVEIVKKSDDSDALNLSDYETSNYDGIISLFNNVSNSVTRSLPTTITNLEYRFLSYNSAAISNASRTVDFVNLVR